MHTNQSTQITGDHISYMTPTTKDTRRADWKTLNFAGSIDWAVDLQAFGKEDLNAGPDRPDSGYEGCISGEDNCSNTGDMCEFSCYYGFCPESLCTCTASGPVEPLPIEIGMGEFVAWDELDVDLNLLCKFVCKYGYWPPDICGTPVVDADEDGMTEAGTDIDNWFDDESARLENGQTCLIYQDAEYRDYCLAPCRIYCSRAIEEAEEAGRTSNYGCLGYFPLGQGIPWKKYTGKSVMAAPGKCSCDNWLFNELAGNIIDAMPIIAQVCGSGTLPALRNCRLLIVMDRMLYCNVFTEDNTRYWPSIHPWGRQNPRRRARYVSLIHPSNLKSSVAMIVILGGRTLMFLVSDMATTAAQMAAYAYPEEEDPEGAFSWWLSPCGGTNLVPDDIKRAFDILSTVADGVSSFSKPKNIPKGSGRKAMTPTRELRQSQKPVLEAVRTVLVVV